MTIIPKLLVISTVFGLCLSCTPQQEPEKPSTDGDKIAVTGVTITRTTLEMYAGDRFKLQARVSPANATNPKVSWSSSEETVVTIDPQSGYAQALEEGTATITPPLRRTEALPATAP